MVKGIRIKLWPGERFSVQPWSHIFRLSDWYFTIVVVTQSTKSSNRVTPASPAHLRHTSTVQHLPPLDMVNCIPSVEYVSSLEGNSVTPEKSHPKSQRNWDTSPWLGSDALQECFGLKLRAMEGSLCGSKVRCNDDVMKRWFTDDVSILACVMINIIINVVIINITSSSRASRGRKFQKKKDLYSKERICL